MTEQIKPTGNPASAMPQVLLAASGPPQSPSRRGDPAVPPSDSAGGRPSPVSVESLEASAKQVEDHLRKSGSDLVFQMDKESGRTVFKIVAQGTKEVLLQVPSEEILAMARKLREQSFSADTSGVLMDKEG